MASKSDPESHRRGKILLRLARAALDEALKGAAAPADEDDAPWLREPGATFVTLRQDGELRGCVGSVQAIRPLIEDVRRNAVAAARNDPRFPPLAPADLDQVEIEVTLLSPLEPMTFTSESEALAQLHPGSDGLLLRWHGHRATYLPQVWEALPEPARFLASLKRKAGLASDFWHPDLELLRYTARHWSEWEMG